MKKLLAIFVCLMLVFSLCACDMLFPSDGNGNTSDTTDKEFDTNRVTFLSAYAEAQELGFEGTLEEFIELISGKDAIFSVSTIRAIDAVLTTDKLDKFLERTLEAEFLSLCISRKEGYLISIKSFVCRIACVAIAIAREQHITRTERENKH